MFLIAACVAAVSCSDGCIGNESRCSGRSHVYVLFCLPNSRVSDIALLRLPVTPRDVCSAWFRCTVYVMLCQLIMPDRVWFQAMR